MRLSAPFTPPASLPAASPRDRDPTRLRPHVHTGRAGPGCSGDTTEGTSDLTGSSVIPPKPTVEAPAQQVNVLPSRGPLEAMRSRGHEVMRSRGYEVTGKLQPPPCEAPRRERFTSRNTWMSWFLVTRCAFFAVHVAVSSLSPVSIQTWNHRRKEGPWLALLEAACRRRRPSFQEHRAERRVSRLPP